MKTDAMTSRERIVAGLEGQPVDRVPFCPFLAYVWDFFPEAIRQAGELAFHRWAGSDPLWRGAPCPVRAKSPDMEVTSYMDKGRQVSELKTPVGSLRLAGMGSETGRTHFLVEHPLKTEEDYKVQMWIEEHTTFEYEPTSAWDCVKGPDSSEGLPIGMLCPRGKSAFQSLVEHHAGTEELQYHLADFPETVRALREVMVRKDLEAVRLAAQFEGYRYWLTWEDSSTQNYSPAQYDEFIGAEIGAWCRILAEHDKKYIQHACGHTRALVGRMKNHGVFAVESMSPPPTGNLPLRECRERVGNNFGIIGGIEPIHFLEMDTDALGLYVEEVVGDGLGGPFVLANSDSCPPGVTADKFKRVADVVRRLSA